MARFNMLLTPQPLQRVACSGVAALLILLGAAIGRAFAADAALSRGDLLWLDRVTYGIDSASIDRFRKLGRQHFLDAQLAARGDDLPVPIQAQIDAFEITRTPAMKLIGDEFAARARIRALDKSDEAQQLRQQRNQVGNTLVDEAVQRELLRAIYSPQQLRQQMAWFWLNHFNVFAQKADIRWSIADYADNAIRPRVFGRFRDLVMATLTHPAMLQYLDNAQNAAGHINENYARELMELHTLGVDAGYGQHDVQELARVLTGVGIERRPENAPANAKAIRDGAFAFHPGRHDFGDKILLGQTIKGRGFAEVEQAVDILVHQPACARFISRKLAAYFVADTPPPALLDAMVRTFQRSDGDIAAVLRTLFDSREFNAALGGQFKDPLHFVVSSVRLAYDGRPVANARPIQRWLGALGEAPFGHPSPDGYALDENAWASSGQLARRFEIARNIGFGDAHLFDGADGDASAAPGFPNLSNRLYYEDLSALISKKTRAALAQATSPQEWNVFLLAAPEMNYR